MTCFDFSTYNHICQYLNIDVDSTGTIEVSCTANSSVSIAIGPSGNTGGFSPRKLKQTSGSDLMNYNLYTTSARTTIWGDGTQGTSTVNQLVRKQSPSNLTVYGTVPASQDVYVGLYTDSLVVTINY
ncbi:MAG: SCPU domain-containing protein [Syntrophus sp. (in: bacteria)]|nr:SCPU domain-containing protein [Syntrophus sp. (in: bacteria)]